MRGVRQPTSVLLDNEGSAIEMVLKAIEELAEWCEEIDRRTA